MPIEPIEEPSGFSGDMYSNLTFEHDPHNNDYKVSRVIKFDKRDEVEFVVKEYSLRSESLKNKLKNNGQTTRRYGPRSRQHL